MIRVTVADNEYRWLNPLRILGINPWVQYANVHTGTFPAYQPDDGRSTIFTAGMGVDGKHSTPPASRVVYVGCSESQPDFYTVQETPEQIADQMRKLMHQQVLTIHPSIPPGGLAFSPSKGTR